MKFRRDATFTWSEFHGMNPLNADGYTRSGSILCDGFEMESFA